MEADSLITVVVKLDCWFGYFSNDRTKKCLFYMEVIIISSFALGLGSNITRHQNYWV